MSSILKLTEQIKELILRAGFDKSGIAAAKILPKSVYLENWLARGNHGDMNWMEKYLEKRSDISVLYPEAKSVIVVAHNYYSAEQHSSSPQNGKISRYAWGEDYHKIIKKKLKNLLNEFRQLIPGLDGRIFCDTAPIQEKLWAEEAGLGWQGKNTNLITRDFGSWIFLGEIVINKNLAYANPVQDYCGKCTACIDACPTNALTPYKLDARKCLSYLTIEYWNKPIPAEIGPKMDNWIFGCDICQDVCPWNRMAQITAEKQYKPKPKNVAPVLMELRQMDENSFSQRFNKSPVKRAKYKNFIRNVKTVSQNSNKSPC